MNRKGKTSETADAFAERFRALRGSLPPKALRVARFIDRNRVIVIASSAATLAASIGTSDATVIRAVQALGFGGLPELKRSLVASVEQRSTLAEDMQRTLAEVGEDANKALDLVLTTHRSALKDLQSTQVRSAFIAAVTILHQAARIVVFGLGRSAHLAGYMAILLVRNGRRAYILDATGITLADQLLDLREGDALLTLAYGRSYREAAAIYAEARKRGLPIVLVTDTLDRKLARQADVVIPVRRGHMGRVALHGTTLIALEAIVIGLAASDRTRALETLQRLNELRDALGESRRNPE
ncbi:MAG TPA: MurR/RpiR family transcriptional regulator [Rhizomicrobium sp.]|jgi:DNA-binding MurR/RpiR family transcriptional regulator|nr:MurR/RpiR family transcriptional regulator [Rhizomicrobium sp.]